MSAPKVLLDYAPAGPEKQYKTRGRSSDVTRYTRLYSDRTRDDTPTPMRQVAMAVHHRSNNTQQQAAAILAVSDRLSAA